MQALFSLLSMPTISEENILPSESAYSASATKKENSEVSDDPRLGTLIQSVQVADIIAGSVVIIGFPYDEGCKRNGGRIGSKKGPEVFRQFVHKMGTVVNREYDVDLSQLCIQDVGDIDCKLTLEEAHAKLEDMVADVLGRGGLPFVIGGSNDQSYCNASALMRVKGKDVQNRIGVVNIDAHLDVRPRKLGKVHSGSPFRLLLEDSRFCGPAKKGRYTPFEEFAAQGSQCSATHVQYVYDKGASITWLQDCIETRVESTQEVFREVLDKLAHKEVKKETSSGSRKRKVVNDDDKQARRLFVSFDLDSVTGADAPGVSCPGTVGLTAQNALDICMEAGSCVNVDLFDLSEFNPKVDDYRTGRLVANMFYFFLVGYALRDKRNVFKRNKIAKS